MVIQTLIYFWAVAFVRFAILGFLPRLSQDRMILYTIYAVGSIVLIQTIVAFVYRLMECSPVADNFKPPIIPGLKCKGLKPDQAMMIGHGVVGLVVDIALLVLPIYIICTKMIWSRKAIQVMLVLSVGVFVIVTGIVRLYMIVTLDFTIDPTYKMATIGIWTDLEGHVGLWCGCFPALQPILRIVSYKLGLRSHLQSNQKSSGQYPRQYGYGSGVNKSGTRKSGYVRNGSGVDREGAGTDEDGDSQRAIIIQTGGIMELKELEPNGMGHGRGIQKTTQVEVRSEPKGEEREGRGHRLNRSWVDMSA